MKRKVRFGWALAALMVLGVISTSVASEFRSGDRISIPEGTTINDEVYAFGQSIVVSGTITSDLTSAGNDLRVSDQGSVGGSANLAGSTVNVAGRIQGNLRAAGNQVTVAAPVGANAAIAGSEVMLAGAGRIGRDLFAAGNTVDVEGSVGRNLRIGAQEATINAPVGGNVNVDANRVVIGPEAVITGNLVYTSPQRAQIDPGARIVGRTIHREREEREDGFEALRWFMWVIGFISLLLVGLLMLAVAPATTADAAQTIFRKPWLSLLIGFVLLVVVPAIVTVLFFTVVGIPLALILLAMYLILLYVSRVIVALAIGQWIFTRAGRPQTSRFLMFFVGLLIYWLLTAIPFIGGLISFVGLLLGLGALAWSRYNFLRQMRTEGRV